MAQADNSVETLNSFLRGELSAVETYEKAMAHVDERRRDTLQVCHDDHEQRVKSLRERIEQLGGKPAESSGAWGAFAKVVQSGADTLGEKAAIDALEAGEDHGLADYQRDADKVKGDLRRFVRMDLLPAQKRTHDLMSKLKHTLH